MLSLAVVGTQHSNTDKRAPTRRFAIDLCRPGDPVQLVPEPKNPADPRAVMVLNREGMMMGYVTAERCGMVRRRLEEGGDVRAIFQASTAWGAIVRVTFDGSDPMLPAVAEGDPAAERDDSFYPDEVWPDE